MERTTLHIVGGESRSRAEQARIAFAVGQHAEVYADLEELLQRRPGEGIVLSAESGAPGGVRRLIDRLGDSGVWLPVVITSPAIELERVVSAIRAGALDYLALPLEMRRLDGRLRAIATEAASCQARRRIEAEARRRILRLSRRILRLSRRQHLALLSAGQSNKEIAQRLEISPRTVEIHRGNMMTKLGATHPADAVRAWIAAGLDGPISLEPDPDGGTGLAREWLGEMAPMTARRQRQ